MGYSEMVLKSKDVERAAHYAGISPQSYQAAGGKAPEGRVFYIYQLKSGLDNHMLRFCGLDTLRRERGEDFMPQLKNYECQYAGVLKEGETLEDVYSQFNLARPEDFKGHSLSVSDVVAVEWEGHFTANYVDSLGFESFPQMAQEIQKEVTALRQQTMPLVGEITYPNGERQMFLDKKEYLAALRSEEGRSYENLAPLCAAIAAAHTSQETTPQLVRYDEDLDLWMPEVAVTPEQILKRYEACPVPNFEVLQFRCKDMVYQAQVLFHGKASWHGVLEQSGQLYVATGNRIDESRIRHDFNASQTDRFNGYLVREEEKALSYLR